MSEREHSTEHVTVVSGDFYDAMMNDGVVGDPSDAIRSASLRAREVVRKEQVNLSVFDATGYVAAVSYPDTPQTPGSAG